MPRHFFLGQLVVWLWISPLENPQIVSDHLSVLALFLVGAVRFLSLVRPFMFILPEVATSQKKVSASVHWPLCQSPF